MNVIQKSLTDEAIENRDYRDYLTISIDGKESFCVSDGEPEDATLARDFNDCWGVVDLMKKAHEAGVNGEEFIVESMEVSIDDI